MVKFLRHSDDIRSRGAIGAIQGALSTPWNPWSAATVRHEVEGFRPDVVHVHNTFPLLSPAIFRSIGHRAARVLTLHNYRLFCPAAIPMRDGKACTDCLDSKSSWSSLRHGCYRGESIGYDSACVRRYAAPAIRNLDSSAGCVHIGTEAKQF